MQEAVNNLKLLVKTINTLYVYQYIRECVAEGKDFTKEGYNINEEDINVIEQLNEDRMDNTTIEELLNSIRKAEKRKDINEVRNLDESIDILLEEGAVFIQELKNIAYINEDIEESVGEDKKVANFSVKEACEWLVLSSYINNSLLNDHKDPVFILDRLDLVAELDTLREIEKLLAKNKISDAYAALNIQARNQPDFKLLVPVFSLILQLEEIKKVKFVLKCNANIVLNFSFSNIKDLLEELSLNISAVIRSFDYKGYNINIAVEELKKYQFCKCFLKVKRAHSLMISSIVGVSIFLGLPAIMAISYYVMKCISAVNIDKVLQRVGSVLVPEMVVDKIAELLKENTIGLLPQQIGLYSQFLGLAFEAIVVSGICAAVAATITHLVTEFSPSVRLSKETLKEIKDLFEEKRLEVVNAL